MGGLTWLLFAAAVAAAAWGYGGISTTSLFLARFFTAAALAYWAMTTRDRALGADVAAAWKAPMIFFGLFFLLAAAQAGTLRVEPGWTPATLERFVTIQSCVQLVFYAVFLFAASAVLRNEAARSRMTEAVLWVGVFFAVAGVIQRAAEPRAMFWKPYSDTLSVSFGPFRTENHYGAFAGLILPIAAAKAYLAPRPGNKIGYALTACFLLATVFYATAFAPAFVLTCLIVLAAILAARRTRDARLCVAAIAALAVSGILLEQMGLGGMLAELLSRQTMSSSATGRLKVYAEVFGLVRDYPLWGTGLGTFGLISSRYVSENADQFRWIFVHNDYLELLAETGIAGFVFFLAGIAAMAVPAARALRRVRGEERVWILQGLFAVLAVGGMEAVDFHLKLPANAYLFLFQLAVIWSAVLRSSPASFTAAAGSMHFRPAVRAAALLICGALTLFAWNDFTANIALDRPQIRAEDLERSVMLQPGHARLWHELGTRREAAARAANGFFDRKLELTRALQAYRKAAELSPAYAYYWSSKSGVELKLGLRQAAGESTLRSLRLNPYSTTARRQVLECVTNPPSARDQV